jgi:polysaccharide biosynthesis transport protein
VELGGYFRVLRRWWLIIVLVTASAGVTGYLVATLVEPTYESSTRLLVGPVSSDDFDALRVAGQLTRTYAELVTGEGMLVSAIREVPLTLSMADVRSAVRARGDTETRLLTITVQLSDPDLAALTADHLASALQEMTAAAPGSPGAVQVIGPAQVPTRPVAPQVPLMVLLATAAGFVAAAVTVLLVDYRRDFVSGREDLDILADLPLLATVPTGPRQGATLAALVSEEEVDDPGSPYRRLARSLVAAQKGPRRSLLVAGTSDDDRNGEVALNIAAGIARNGLPATLLDADELSRSITRMLALDPEGRKAIRAGERPLQLLRGRLEIIPYRPTAFSDQPQADLQRTLEDLSASGRVLIVHAGALSSSPSAAIWAGQCNTSVVVAFRDSTRRHALADAIKDLRALKARLNGIILAEPGRG